MENSGKKIEIFELVNFKRKKHKIKKEMNLVMVNLSMKRGELKSDLISYSKMKEVIPVLFSNTPFDV